MLMLMSAVETGQMSAVETRQMYSIRTGRRPVLVEWQALAGRAWPKHDGGFRSSQDWANTVEESGQHQ